MARPRQEQPTPGELEVLKHLWELGRPASVRQVLERVNEQAAGPRAYTSVMSLLNVMAEKGLVERTPEGRAFLYAPRAPREKTLRSMLSETLERVYDGSASLLVAHLLDQSAPTQQELAEIQKLIEAYQKRGSSGLKGGKECLASPPTE